MWCMNVLNGLLQSGHGSILQAAARSTLPCSLCIACSTARHVDVELGNIWIAAGPLRQLSTKGPSIQDPGGVDFYDDCCGSGSRSGLGKLARQNPFS